MRLPLRLRVRFSPQARFDWITRGIYPSHAPNCTAGSVGDLAVACRGHRRQGKAISSRTVAADRGGRSRNGASDRTTSTSAASPRRRRRPRRARPCSSDGVQTRHATGRGRRVRALRGHRTRRCNRGARRLGGRRFRAAASARAIAEWLHRWPPPGSRVSRSHPGAGTGTSRRRGGPRTRLVPVAGRASGSPACRRSTTKSSARRARNDSAVYGPRSRTTRWNGRIRSSSSGKSATSSRTSAPVVENLAVAAHRW